jgi:hypothetical protein
MVDVEGMNHEPVPAMVQRSKDRPMSKTTPAKQEAPAQRETKVHVIRPGAVYSLAQATPALGLTNTTLGREVRLRRLRVSRRAGRYFITGAWLLEWIEAGELKEKGGERNGREVNGEI